MKINKVAAATVVRQIVVPVEDVGYEPSEAGKTDREVGVNLLTLFFGLLRIYSK